MLHCSLGWLLRHVLPTSPFAYPHGGSGQINQPPPLISACGCLCLVPFLEARIAQVRSIFGELSFLQSEMFPFPSEPQTLCPCGPLDHSGPIPPHSPLVLSGERAERDRGTPLLTASTSLLFFDDHFTSIPRKYVAIIVCGGIDGGIDRFERLADCQSLAMVIHKVVCTLFGHELKVLTILWAKDTCQGQ